ncbi:LCP family protein [Nocardiopsis sp. FIRDI 009]|uniref:LCP family protein n=1 Tax=Nocardiopsis sp. FIRDI 009 TaxID=714197 RepID=UPI000E21E3B8|nr:LCP family protein [Nocardiopsis sp. FIRDI 009]
MSAGQWAACVLTGVLIAASLTAYGAYASAFDIRTEQIDTDTWGDRPDRVEGVHNILLLGVDTESGGDRPDVLVIVNVNVDAGAVTMVNVPRDLVVDIPACDPVGDSPGWSGGRDQINHSMMYGGLNCLGDTMENTTGIHLDHMVQVDFAGFEDIVDTVGGVEMCIPAPIDDPKADLRLEAGRQRLDGAEALGLARSRASTEFGSDLGRIQSQQRLIGALAREVTGGEFLSSPTSVYSLLDSVTDNLVTDDALTVDRMAELVIAVRDVNLDRMNMVMVPVVDSREFAYKVEVREPEASELFAAVAAGEPLAEEDGGEDDVGDGAAGEDVDPSDVSLRLLNGTATDGLAGVVRPLLEAEGFTVTDIGNPEQRPSEVTTVYHGPGRETQARVLADALDTARVEEAADLGDELELVMGATDWKGLATEGSGGDGADPGDGGDPLDGLESRSAADTVTCS